MCVIAYKPLGTMFPSQTILENCFNNNPDGAGFMYSYNGKVHLQKGYTTFESFNKALNKARNTTGDEVPYVMHFRIATQGFEKTMTHPFPLSKKMSDLKQTKGSCDIGIAHNGILDITSDGSKEYSDTMKFITDYLSLIIKKLAWHKDEDTKQLIENLIDGSRLAILDKNSHCELMGKGWVEDNGIHYSNNSYSYKKSSFVDFGKWGNWGTHWNWNDYNVEDEYEKYYNFKTKLYDFDVMNCPATLDFDDSYCYLCSQYRNCPYAQPEFYEQVN
jgi:hypothetical protein